MSVTVDGASQPPNEDEAGASARPGADETAGATYPVPEDERQGFSRKRVGVGAAALIGFGAGAPAAGMIAARRDSDLTLRPGETISMRAQPRKGFWRYILTFGLWELDRRATQFTLTNQRLVVEKGLLHRVVSAVPLGDVQRVIVRTGPFEGTVSVS